MSICIYYVILMNFHGNLQFSHTCTDGTLCPQLYMNDKDVMEKGGGKLKVGKEEKG